jgi:hypothetical protein
MVSLLAHAKQNRRSDLLTFLHISMKFLLCHLSPACFHVRYDREPQVSALPESMDCVDMDGPSVHSIEGRFWHNERPYFGPRRQLPANSVFRIVDVTVKIVSVDRQKQMKFGDSAISLMV